MKQEHVETIVNRLAAGNGEMRYVLGMIANVGANELSAYPEEADGVVARKLLQATSLLVKKHIPSRTYLELGTGYWQTKDGQVTKARVHEYVAAKIEAVRQIQTATANG
ncbi:MAG TPA: hypothetical protein VF828_02230 [Patescibacteria group bacterium]